MTHRRISHTSLFRLSPNPYMVLDRDFCFLDANEAYLRVTGRTLGDLLGRNLFDAFPGNPADPDDTSVEQLRHSLEQVLAEKQTHHLALIRYAIPGEANGEPFFEERFWSATHVPVLDERGEVAAILQHTVDVTELQRLKRAARVADVEGGLFQRAQAVQARHDQLDAQQRHLRRLFDQAPGFIAVLRGPLHVFELVNQAYYQMVGRREIIGKPVREALPEIAGQGFLELLDRVHEAGQPYVGRGVKVALRTRPDAPAEDHFLDFIYQPILEDDGSVSGILAQGHDVTVQHQAQQDMQRYRQQLEDLLQERTVALVQSRAQHAETQAQLEHVQRLEALGRLTGGVAHDFNNLLQVMNNSLLLIQRTTAGNAAAERWIGMARAAVNNGSRLTGQLLAFACRQPLAPLTLNVGRMLNDMKDVLRSTLGDGVEIATVIAEDLWNLSADPTQLENVILNLAINARDAMQGHGRLTLKAANVALPDAGVAAHPELTGDEYVLLCVADSGPGMAPEVLARAFEPFFSTKPPGQGTGLGLSMVYGFVRQSGGHVRIDAEPGQGTVVKIYLPRAHQMEEHRQPPAEGAAVGGSETILVVEDDPAVLATTVESLTDLGYKVLEAHNGEQALPIVRSGVPIDLLFTDVVMPGSVRSPELARLAREVLPDLEVLFTSGYTEDEVVHDGRLDPGVQLISKPYGRDELAHRIRQLLEGGRKRRVGEGLTAEIPPISGRL